jgi:anaerobic ribonucleoside-triphosphate reductase activating protein
MERQTNPYLKLLEIPPGYLNIMGYVDESEVNGPGCRSVIWVQGCLRECSGCFNPTSWSFEINQLIAVDTLVHQIPSNPHNQGVTFSGGEPFWQAPALADLARRVKAAGLKRHGLYWLHVRTTAIGTGSSGCSRLAGTT